MDEAQGRLAQAQQRAAVLQADRDRLRQEVEAARRDQAIYRERRNSLRQQIEEAESELPLLESAANTALAEVEAATVDLKAAQDDLHAQQAHLQEFRTVFESRRAEIATRQAEVQRVEVEQRQTQNALAQAQGQLEQLRVRLGELRSDAEPVAIDGAADETIATLEATAGTARNEVIRLQSSRNDGNRARSADINRLKDLRRALRDAEQQLNRVRNDIARQEERVAQLNRQGQRAIDLEPERVIGRLASLVRIPPEHETAVVAALGDRLAAWLVTDSDGLWRAVAKARAGRDGSEARLSLVAGDVPPSINARPDISDEPGAIGWASDRIAADGAAAALVGRLLGNVLLVDDAATAYRLATGWPPGYVAVAPDGLLVYGGGLVEVSPGSGSNILSVETRRREEASRLDGMRADLARRENELAGQQKR